MILKEEMSFRFPAAERDLLVQAADRFLRSRHPMMILAVPGCQPIAINEAHTRSAILGKVEAKRLGDTVSPGFRGPWLICTREEYCRVVESARNELSGGQSDTGKRGERAKANHPVVVCYCERAKAIIAVDSKDCAFEDGFEALLRTDSERPEKRLEFNLTGETPSGGRVYRTSRVHIRLLGRTDRNARTARGLIEVRVAESDFLQMTVESEKAASSDDVPSALWMRVSLSIPGSINETVLPLKRLDISFDRLKPYLHLDQALKRASSAPMKAREILEKATAEVEMTASYPVYQVLVADLFQRDLTNAELSSKIREIRTRLWDAPVAGGDARELLEDLLEDSKFLQFVQLLPLRVRADLAGLRLDSASLEAADGFVGTLPIPGYAGSHSIGAPLT